MSIAKISSPRCSLGTRKNDPSYVTLPFDPATVPFNYRDTTFVEISSTQKLYHYMGKYCASAGLNSFRSGGAKVQTKEERQNEECNPTDKPDFGLRLGLDRHSFSWTDSEGKNHHFTLLHQARDAHPGVGKDAVPIDSMVLFLQQTGDAARATLESFFDSLEELYNGNDMGTTKVYRSTSYAPKLLGRRANRTLDSVFLPTGLLDSIVDDMEHFAKAETKRRYNELGITYKRGYMFSGPPGTGKTSTIRALAAHSNRELLLMANLNKMSDQELMTCMSRSPKRAIIVLEDLDRLFNQHKVKKVNLGITTEGLLQVMDGIGSPEGRIIIITCNQPKFLPDALFRPGRVDQRFEFNLLSWRADKKVIYGMFKKYHGHLGALNKEQKGQLKHAVCELSRHGDGIQMSQMQEVMLKTIHLTSIDEVLSSLEVSVKAVKGKSRRESEMYA